MAVAKLGFGSAVGVGVESTWGTPVSRTNWVRITSWGLKRTLEIVPRPHLGTTSATSTNRRQHFTASDDAGGSFEYLCAYDDSSILLLTHALGAVATTGTGPYVHTVTLASSAGNGLSIEGLNGNGSAEVFEGCLLTRTEISISAAEVMKIRHDVIGETSQGLASAGTPTFSSNGEEVLHSHAGQFSFDSVTHDLVDLSIIVDHKLAKRQLLGSTLTKRPQLSDYLEVTGRLTVEYIVDTTNTKWLAGTQGDATITFTGSGNNVLAMTLQNLYISNIDRAVSSPGVIRETVEFRCESDGTDEGLKLVFTNDNAASTAN